MDRFSGAVCASVILQCPPLEARRKKSPDEFFGVASSRGVFGVASSGGVFGVASSGGVFDERLFEKTAKKKERMEGARDAGGPPALPGAASSSRALTHGSRLTS